MTTKVRFAPSPTGLLHVGNARTALINGLFARTHGGRFLLRFDDTDRDRSKPEYASAIEADLHWLGLEWDERVRQSDRLEAYEAVFRRLRAEGRIYPCWETPEELEYKRKRQLARGRPPVYDRAALSLGEAERRALEAEGRRPHWRFLLQAETVSWDDLVRGPVSLQADHMSDPVVVRADGTFLYMLPSTIDDADLAITHVIRGEDHVANTAVQIQMFRAIGAVPPAFAHLPLLTDIAGKGLSKRLGSMTVASLRDEGVEAMALAGYLARLGTGEPAQARLSLAELAAEFDIARFGRATPKFDPAQLAHLNDQVLHASPWEAVADRFQALGMTRANEAFWNAVKANVRHLSECRYWYEVCFGDVATLVPDQDFATRAADLLPAEPWDEGTWDVWTRAIQEWTGRKGKALFLPLRMTLTGRQHGPEMRGLLPLIGRKVVERRLLRQPLEPMAVQATESKR